MIDKFGGARLVRLPSVSWVQGVPVAVAFWHIKEGFWTARVVRIPGMMTVARIFTFIRKRIRRNA
jgi:hypothetical protein